MIDCSRCAHCAGAVAVLVLAAAGCGGNSIVSAEPGSGGAAGAGGGAGSDGASGTAGAVQSGGKAGAGGAVPNGGASGAGGSVQTGGAAGAGAAGAGADGAVADASADAADSVSTIDSSDVSSPPPIICPAGVSGHCSSAAYPAYAGFTLNLVEDFDAPIDLASDPIWTYSDGVGDSRYSRYKKDALSFSDGTLIVTASKPASGVANADYPTYADGTQASYPAPVVGSSAIQTGEIRTKHNNYRYGRYEARMKAPWNEPGVRDYLIAAVFTHRSPKWQDWREVDVEATPYSGPTSIGTNIIYGDNCSTYDRTRNSYRTIPLGMLAADASIYDDFHTYAIELLPTRVTWFVDGTQIREETGAGVKLPERSMKLIVGVIIYPGGCDWTACTPPSYPMRSEIDWIRFYKYDGDDTYPCSPTPGCLPYEDRDYAKNNAEDGVAVVTGDI